MNPDNQYLHDEIAGLNRAHYEAARWFANIRWNVFCDGSVGYESKLEGKSAGYRRFAQRLFQEGFEAGYILYSHGTLALNEASNLLRESWIEANWIDENCDYVGNPDSSFTTDTVPEAEAWELFRIGFEDALILVVRLKTSTYPK